MNITLINYTDPSIIEISARICYQSFKNSKINGIRDFKKTKRLSKKVDIDFLKRLLNMKHYSVFEHANFNFYCEDIPFIVLRHITRHRLTSLSVKSSRYTLTKLRKKIINCKSFKNYEEIEEIVNSHLASDIPKRDRILEIIMDLLINLPNEYYENNDILEMILPLCWKTEFMFTLNFRELIHILDLRLSDKAHFYTKNFAKLLFETLPDIYKELYIYYKNENL